jgi:hypothetical protein
MVLIDNREPQTQKKRWLWKQLQRIVSDARPKQHQKLKEFFYKFQDITTKTDEYRRRVRIDPGNNCPICQSLASLQLAKQAQANEILKDIEEWGTIKESNRNLCFYVDYRAVNVVTKGCFPLPKINGFDNFVFSFGLCNASVMFERLIKFILRVLLQNQNDVIITGRKFQEQPGNQWKVSQRLRRAPLQTNPKKRHLSKNNLDIVRP